MSPQKNPPSQAGIFDREILFSGSGIQAIQERNPDVEHAAEDRIDTQKEEENDPGIEVYRHQNPHQGSGVDDGADFL